MIGYDKASKIAHYADDNNLTLKEAALKLGFVSEDEFDMVKPYVANGPNGHRRCLRNDVLSRGPARWAGPQAFIPA